MKKCLILTVTAGGGHNSAARSMMNILKEQGADVRMCDLMRECAPAFSRWIVDEGYNMSVGYFRHIYNAFFELFAKEDVKKAAVCSAQVSVRKVNGKLLKLIYEYQPDVIYATSYYCSMAVTNLKRAYPIPAKLVTVMLDYVAAPFWESSAEGVDFIGLSHDAFKEGMLKKGFTEQQLISSGVPVSEKFTLDCDKKSARQALGLDEDRFTVLIMFGGGHWQGGYKMLKALVKYIKVPMQIVIVNGKDKRSKNRIEKNSKKYPENLRVLNIGYSDSIDKVMAACDVMVGKGGGLSLTESINANIPLISTLKLPEQEIYNVNFLENNKAVLTFKNGKDLADKVLLLYSDRQLLEDIKERLARLKTEGLRTLSTLILNQPDADYSAIDAGINYKKVNKKVNAARKKAAKLAKKAKA